MVTLVESGMTFGPFLEDHFFHLYIIVFLKARWNRHEEIFVSVGDILIMAISYRKKQCLPGYPGPGKNG